MILLFPDITDQYFEAFSVEVLVAFWRFSLFLDGLGGFGCFWDGR